MSKLKKRFAEIQQMEDGMWLDTDTGEITELKPTETSGVQFKEEVPRAASKYPNNDYQNQWGKVSPFNIIIKDLIGQLYGMKPAEMAELVDTFIRSLNKEFGAMDETYDYVSDDYLRKLKFNLQKTRTSDKAIEYLTNVYFKGMGMGSSNFASLKNGERTLKINIADANKLKLAITAINTYSSLLEKVAKLKK